MMSKLICFAVIHFFILKSESDSFINDLDDTLIKTEKFDKVDRVKREGIIQRNDQYNCGTHKYVRPTIVGGKNTERGEFPWKAALVLKSGEFFCGGTLVSNQMVVTAAHCIKGKQNSHEFESENISVLLGVYDFSCSNEKGRISSNVKAIQIHPDWNTQVDSYDADIAVLILESIIEFNNYIQPICLDGQHSPIAQASSGITVGFGKTETGRISNIAKKLELPIIDHHKCSKKEDVFQYILSSRTFCGGSGDGTGVCEGDSGSGLFVAHNDRFYLRGVTSAASVNNVNECNVNKVSLFTDATNFCGWIRSGGLIKYAVCIENELVPSLSGQNILYEGECLKPNEYLESYNKNLRIVFHNDGQLAHYQRYSKISRWSSNAGASCVDKACMQFDGNFVVSDCNQTPIFTTNTAGNLGSRIIIQNDGNFVLYNLKNNPIWSSNTYSSYINATDVEHASLRYPSATTSKPITNTLHAGECLEANEYLESNNKCFKVIYQADGDFVQYQKNKFDDYIWCTHTPRTCVNKLCLLDDGNLVLKDCNNKTLFATDTSGNPRSKLIQNDNGNLAIYSQYGSIVWATNRFGNC